MSDESQHNAQLEGLAIGLEQRGEVSAAHVIRLALKRLQLDAEADARPDPIKRWDGKFKGGSTSTIVDQSGPISDQDAMSDDIKDIKIGGISPTADEIERLRDIVEKVAMGSFLNDTMFDAIRDAQKYISAMPSKG